MHGPYSHRPTFPFALCVLDRTVENVASGVHPAEKFSSVPRNYSHCELFFS